MPANKNQIRRIQTILKMMRQNRYPNYTSFIKEMKNQDIAGAYKLSSTTFLREIADLRDEYGAPIHYDSSRKGFYLSNIDWYNEDLMVEPFEMKAALIGERIASGILPEPLCSEMNKAISALLMKNENGMDENAELESFQVLCPEYLPQIKPEIFLTCYNAWEQRKLLELNYCSFKKQRAEKIFEPHIFAWNGGCWYLKGKLLRNDDKRYDEPMIQVLAVHRIEKAEMLESLFWSAPEILKGVKSDGLFGYNKIPEIEMEFFAPFDKAMREKYCHIPDAIQSTSDNSVRVKLHDLTEYDIAQLVMSVCGNVKILTPKDLKAYIRQIAEKIIKNMQE